MLLLWTVQHSDFTLVSWSGLWDVSSLNWQHDWPGMPMEALMDLGVAGNFLVHC